MYPRFSKPHAPGPSLQRREWPGSREGDGGFEGDAFIEASDVTLRGIFGCRRDPHPKTTLQFEISIMKKAPTGLRFFVTAHWRFLKPAHKHPTPIVVRVG